MELDPNDYDVVKLLAKLKHANEIYPGHLLALRRQSFIKRVAEVGVGFGVKAGLKSRNGNRGNAIHITGNLLEIALGVVILMEAGFVAYVYRDKISKILQPGPSNVQVLEVTSSPGSFSFTPELAVTKSLETAGTLIVTETLEVTAIPNIAEETNDKNNGTDDQSNSTPDPNKDNGNHFGQTPKPDRTKPPGDDNDEHAKEQIEGNGWSTDT